MGIAAFVIALVLLFTLNNAIPEMSGYGNEETESKHPKDLTTGLYGNQTTVSWMKNQNQKAYEEAISKMKEVDQKWNLTNLMG